MRSSVKMGNAVSSARTTASSGTSDSVVVNVRLPATCASRTSRERRAAKFSTSRARSSIGAMAASRAGSHGACRVANRWNALSGIIDHAPDIAPAHGTVARNLHARQRLWQKYTWASDNYRNTSWISSFSITRGTDQRVRWPTASPPGSTACAVPARVCGPCRPWHQARKSRRHQFRQPVRRMSNLPTSNPAARSPWARPRASATWPRR